MLAAVPPRSEVGAQPVKQEKKEAQGRSVAAQLAYLAKWAAKWRPAKTTAHHHNPG